MIYSCFKSVLGDLVQVRLNHDLKRLIIIANGGYTKFTMHQVSYKCYVHHMY